MSSDNKVIVIGGGPVGTMQGIFLAKRGFNVELYESKKDIREENPKRGRSINLTLSHRGLEAMKAIGCEDDVYAIAIPMYTRYVHLPNGKVSIQPYGNNGEAILSIERQKLNEVLLDKAEQMTNLKLHFEHKLTRSDMDLKIHTFFNSKRNQEVNISYHFTFGCDGVYSSVRRQMMKWGRLDYSQSNIEHGYKELTMPPNKDGDYAMPCNHFHIWPRQEFMMAAFPNMNKSFTLILFMPFKVFETIKNEQDLLSFFREYFSDCLEKIGTENLIKVFFENPLSSVVSVKCFPYYLNSQVLLMGDAAHAIVPFYGQGLNAGMEDCLIFDEYMSVLSNDLHQSAQQCSKRRWKDGHGMADLSMYNYLEIRSHVASKAFLIRKYLENILYRLFPTTFMPLYTMVTFTRIPIQEVIRRNRKQHKLINIGIRSVAIMGLFAIVYVVCRNANVHLQLSFSLGHKSMSVVL